MNRTNQDKVIPKTFKQIIKISTLDVAITFFKVYTRSTQL